MFIDEFYSMVYGEKDDYGKEALDELCTYMSENKDSIVIAAGYADKIRNNIFSSQPGLQRRFGWVFEIDPYTYEDQDIDIQLSVTPRVNEEGFISIQLNTSVSAIVGYVGPEGDRPITSNRTANTNVMVKDGETLLIGGLIFENDSRSNSQVPILGKIPLLNLLFKSKVDDVEQRELLIFITPSVVG